MSGQRGRSLVVAGVVAGAGLGATAPASVALMLREGAGMLSKAGVASSVLLLALAGGIWAGRPLGEAQVRLVRWRWFAAVGALTLGGFFAELWYKLPALRDLASGSGMAVLALLAGPGYAVGWLLGGLGSREVGGDGAGTKMLVGGLLGAAAGVMVSTTQLIPRHDPGIVFLGSAVCLAAAGLLELSAGSD